MRATTPEILADTNAPVDWEALPDCLTVKDLRRVLRLGRSAAYQFTEQFPGLVIQVRNAKRIPKAGLQRFLARDPEILRIAAPQTSGASTPQLRLA